jgi:hypothetical protein
VGSLAEGGAVENKDLLIGSWEVREAGTNDPVRELGRHLFSAKVLRFCTGACVIDPA